MPTGLSFDPRTWLHPPAAPPASVSDQPAAHRRSGERPRASWLALGVSLALLAGGALAAYETRDAEPTQSADAGS